MEDADAIVKAAHVVIARHQLPKDLEVALSHGNESYSTLKDVVLPVLQKCRNELRALKEQQVALKASLSAGRVSSSSESKCLASSSIGRRCSSPSPSGAATPSTHKPVI